MLKTEMKLDYSICSNNEGIPVIVVAAGSSSRMQGTNKQLAEVGGIPVIIKTLLRFENCDAISGIVLVVRDEDLFQIQMLTQKYNITKLTDIVCGGKTRQDSVLKGFSRLKDGCEKVLIHDGARPFVTNDIICSVASSLDEYSAVTCAVKVKDTIKSVDANGKVIKTLNRNNLVSVQTPQGVRVSDYFSAIQSIDVSNFTDDTSIMEAAGYTVYVVDGSYKNIKITTKEDLVLAQGFLSEEEND